MWLFLVKPSWVGAAGLRGAAVTRLQMQRFIEEVALRKNPSVLKHWAQGLWQGLGKSYSDSG